VDANAPVVGFDLDMTLIDSRPGLVDTLAALEQEIGESGLAHPDAVDALFASNVDLEFAKWFGAERAPALADRFREIYRTVGVVGTGILPGAREAVATARAAGVKVIVVTAKFGPNAVLCLDHVELEVDAVFGRLHGTQKSEVLREHRAFAYLGDTTADMAAAHAAGAAAVGVATGPASADDLRTAGAEVVLSSLAEFPAWWATSLRPS
jgi:phosphoglycolate phosphatase